MTDFKGVENYEVLSNREIAANVHEMVVRAPLVAEKARAGQFTIVMAHEVGEKIPLTLSDWDPNIGTITLYYLEAGLSTRKLTFVPVGASLYSVVGPLGTPTEIRQFGRVFLGGGCYGVGGIFPVARALKRAGNEVWTCTEARSEFLLFNREKFSGVSDRHVEVTSDGSAGEQGRVEDVLRRLLGVGEEFDRAYFMGCPRMMRRCSEVTKGRVPTRVWLNSIMLDGTGMCGCCRVRVGGETKFACVDGPEFDGHEVDWDELYTRKSSYIEEENLAYQFHACDHVFDESREGRRKP
ncbi:MAG: sulfide/dihydroorotate dehydrogenase-like FAD/NAD-binding protein [Promethearchaeota archaeon]